jgi:UDP-3-O-[3-hydroxymyristoyl] glucosamine N-acyltransferase
MRACSNRFRLGKKWRVGRNTLVRRQPARGFRLGDSSTIGDVVIRTKAEQAAGTIAIAEHHLPCSCSVTLTRFDDKSDRSGS